jgi:hypothetical protein
MKNLKISLIAFSLAFSLGAFIVSASLYIKSMPILGAIHASVFVPKDCAKFMRIVPLPDGTHAGIYQVECKKSTRS